MQHLVYLHGFLSSPQSLKAQQTLAYVKKHLPSLSVHMPLLSGNVNKALILIDSLMHTLPKGQVGFIGSSMGGFLTTYCVEKYGGKGVLINPAVTPFDLFADYLGQHENPNTGETFCITPLHINKLQQIHAKSIKDPKHYLVMLQTGDETLDYRLALAQYQGANIVVEEGGDHSFINYADHLPKIFTFLR